MLDKEFANNVALHAKVTVSNYRGNNKMFAPANLTDNNNETYWATDDNYSTASMVINLSETEEVKYIVLQEYIKLGQRVKSFNVEVWDNDHWQQVADETTIGYKRILRIEPVKTGKIRVNITSSKACPVLSNIEVY